MHVAPLLPNRTALDIGANIGRVSGRLLTAGYEVFAFEPFPPVFAQLSGSFGHDEHFHAHQLAIGYSDRTMEFHIAEEISSSTKYGESITLYHSLIPHAMPGDLQFGRTMDVRVRSLDSLVRADLIPETVGLIKIDTEGYDLEVIRGMGGCSCHVLVAKFWDPKMIFGRSGALNRLTDLVGEVRPRGYRWHIVIYRLDNKPISYYCNQDQSVDESWGNVIFFKDKQIFDEALQWCSTVLPPTYFTA
jgi:FkbM family methyltransferase